MLISILHLIHLIDNQYGCCWNPRGLKNRRPPRNCTATQSVDVNLTEWCQTGLRCLWGYARAAPLTLDPSQPSWHTFYTGSSIDQDGGCNTNIHRIELACSCMRALDRGIWRTSVSLPTKLCITFTSSQFCFMALTFGRWLVTAISAEPTHCTIMHVHSRPLSTVFQRTGDMQMVVLTSLGCRQSRETSRPRTSASLQRSISHIDVPAIIVSWKRLYSGRSEIPDDDMLLGFRPTVNYIYIQHILRIGLPNCGLWLLDIFVSYWKCNAEYTRSYNRL